MNLFRRYSMAIEVKGLSLEIDKTEILKDINLRLEPGKIYGVIGRNGSGKTMLMKCLCGYVLPSKGEVEYNGQRMGKDIDFPESIGIIIENPGFVPVYSGYRNLKLLASINKRIETDVIKETMKKLDLDPDMKKPVKKYSLGMRQRLGIVQAIMENPKVLILDEPFNGLDVDGVEQVRKILKDMRSEDRIIFLSSHIREDIEILCDEVFSMEKGELVSLTSQESLSKDSDLSTCQVV
jgi:ABC-2 type transport system ATP-binding protein